MGILPRCRARRGGLVGREGRETRRRTDRAPRWLVFQVIGAHGEAADVNAVGVNVGIRGKDLLDGVQQIGSLGLAPVIAVVFPGAGRPHIGAAALKLRLAGVGGPELGIVRLREQGVGRHADGGSREADEQRLLADRRSSRWIEQVILHPLGTGAS